jgi:bifunctional UDP-N-acetylglucosamine pyrophosphorylase / glucosamine-1-phosphate N-acetyltransferase
MTDLHVVVLAAGKGTRMKSARPKVLHRVGGAPLLDYVLRTAATLDPASTVLVIGHMAEQMRAMFRHSPVIQCVVQEPQLGTAHALLQAEPLLRGAGGTLVLLYGDVPLLRPATLQQLVESHLRSHAAATVVTAEVERPRGYGRIIRRNGQVAAIIEERDASPAQREIREVNSGIYAFDLEPLFPALHGIAAENAQGEYYLTDLVGIYVRRGLKVEAFLLEDAREILGINSRRELAEVSRIVNQNRTDELMAAGVTIEDPATTWIGPDVTVGPDTVIHPNVILQGRTAVGSGCEIHAWVRIVDSVLADRVTINNFCVIVESRIAEGATLGPFAHLRPGSDVRESAKVGNFVELKKTVLGAGSKANHLAYLGDATIGERVNVGAGTITCNYDGERKHQTVIEDGAFIGSDSQLVAPIRVGRDAYVAAGSSVVEDVPAGSLAIARGRQVNKEGWVDRKKGRG